MRHLTEDFNVVVTGDAIAPDRIIKIVIQDGNETDIAEMLCDWDQTDKRTHAAVRMDAHFLAYSGEMHNEVKILVHTLELVIKTLEPFLDEDCTFIRAAKIAIANATNLLEEIAYHTGRM